MAKSLKYVSNDKVCVNAVTALVGNADQRRAAGLASLNEALATAMFYIVLSDTKTALFAMQAAAKASLPKKTPSKRSLNDEIKKALKGHPDEQELRVILETRRVGLVERIADMLYTASESATTVQAGLYGGRSRAKREATADEVAVAEQATAQAAAQVWTSFEDALAYDQDLIERQQDAIEALGLADKPNWKDKYESACVDLTIAQAEIMALRAELAAIKEHVPGAASRSAIHKETFRAQFLAA